jgi:hypothetical protein
VSDVETLRQQLRDRGYLSHGIERWFALDPWSSRTFWSELGIVALKAATLLALFGALPPTAVMVARNYPLNPVETLALFLSYAVGWLVIGFVLVVITALALKVRPALPIDTPRALLAISLAASALMTLAIAYWWWRFDTPPAWPELAAGIGATLVFFIFASIVVSAALLSFSIYEVHRIPAIHQKPRGVAMTVVAVVLIALLFVPAWWSRERVESEPMVITRQTTSRIALIAVDGLTWEIVQSRPDLANALPHSMPAAPIGGDSATERWASAGTGVRTTHHGVRSIEGIRFPGGTHILQRISRADFVLRDLAPALRVARREPLPPTVRRRDYVWEIAAKRGVPAAAVNWWATADAHDGALVSVGPESVFGAARGEPLRLDLVAAERFLEIIERDEPRIAAVYLPSLDVILNRVALDQSAQLAGSIRTLDGIATLVATVRGRGYEVILTGMPGERQSGRAVIASSIPIENAGSVFDVAATLLELLGFPLSTEMPGESRAGSSSQPRIASYGSRITAASAQPVNQEYYENLRSLGYIR